MYGKKPHIIFASMLNISRLCPVPPCFTASILPSLAFLRSVSGLMPNCFAFCSVVIIPDIVPVM